MMYQCVISDATVNETRKTFWLSAEEKVDQETIDFAESLFVSAHGKMASTDSTITQFLKDGWPFDRMGEMEKNVLRIAIVELLDGQAPVYAVLDDYTTLARRYSDEKTASFVNGLLENVRKAFQVERSGDSD